MDWDFSKHEILGKLAKSRREILFRWMKEHYSERMTIRMAGGELPIAKKLDNEFISLLAFDADKKVMYALSDYPKICYQNITYNPESFVVVQLYYSAVAEMVGDIIKTNRKESTGRPQKLTYSSIYPYGESILNNILK